MTDFIDKNYVIETINSIPGWVQNEKDLLTFCKHLHLRLLQTKSMLKFYENNFRLTDDLDQECNNIHLKFEEIYAADASSRSEL